VGHADPVHPDLEVLAFVALTVALAVVLSLLGLGNLGLPLALIGAPVLLGTGTLLAWAAWFAAQGLAASVLGTWLVGTSRPGRTVRPAAAVLVGAFVLAVFAQVPVLGALVPFAANHAAHARRPVAVGAWAT